ncbi:hypothetical protein HPB47_024845, partial [Ixodes persulcatus]
MLSPVAILAVSQQLWWMSLSNATVHGSCSSQKLGRRDDSDTGVRHHSHTSEKTPQCNQLEKRHLAYTGASPDDRRYRMTGTDLLRGARGSKAPQWCSQGGHFGSQAALREATVASAGARRRGLRDYGATCGAPIGRCVSVSTTATPWRCVSVSAPLTRNVQGHSGLTNSVDKLASTYERHEMRLTLLEQRVDSMLKRLLPDEDWSSDTMDYTLQSQKRPIPQDQEDTANTHSKNARVSTTLDLALHKGRYATTWENSHENLTSDHDILHITIQITLRKRRTK